MIRINYLDGHRGIAILLVIMFHAYSRWSHLIVYDNDLSQFPVFQYGYLGVQLFFMISGFVILMTLEKCNNILSFIYRRWLRLFPAMLVCSLVIYFTAGMFIERPNGQPEFKDILAGLSFIEPYIWLKITGIELQSIEGVFWSLYVEFKFYIVAAIIYFLIGSTRLVYVLFLCFIMWFSLNYLHHTYSNQTISILHSITSILSFNYFGWFSAGAAYYLYKKTDKSKWIFWGVFFSLTSAMIESDFQSEPFFAAALISIFFMASILNIRLQSIISNKFLLYFGFISYPLYLLHENMMVSIILKLDDYINYVPAFLFPVIAIGLISALSYLISKKIEPAVKHAILSSYNLIPHLLSKKSINNDH